MSQYIQFFARTKNGEYVELAAYSRSSQIYQCAHAPYEKIKCVNKNFFDNIVAQIQEHIDYIKTQIKKDQDLIGSIERFACIDIDERLQRIHEIQDTIEEYQEDIEACQRDIHDMWFIANMLDDYKIYVGIEIGDPTDEDRVDEISDN